MELLSGPVTLRAATPADYNFAQRLYLDGIRPHAQRLMAWDDAVQTSRFAQQWRVEEAQIILEKDRPVGFAMARIDAAEIALLQLYVAPEHQGQGIGSAALHLLLERWACEDKPIALGVLRDNPARRLYERLGFELVGETPTKLLMRRAPG